MQPRKTAILAVLAGSLYLAAAVLAYPTVYPEGVTIHEAGVEEGYVLFSAQDGHVNLVDTDGNVVHSWNDGCASGPPRPLDNGHVLYNSCGPIVEKDWDGTVVWQYDRPPGVIFHHDWERLPNGNTLILCREDITDLSISDQVIREDFLLEVTPAGDVAWEWHSADHFTEFGFSQERLDMIYARGGDWSHANTVSSIPDNTSHSDPRFSAGNIIIGLRHQNTIAIIDRATGDIVWVASDHTLGQHMPHMIPGDRPGGGNILVFDNGYAVDWSALNWTDPAASVGLANRSYSQVLEIDPVTLATPFKYTATFSGYPIESLTTATGGGAERLPGGNTLITETRSGRIFEIDAGKQIVWEYVSPFVGSGNDRKVYRAYKVPLDWAAAYFAPDLAVTGISDSNPVSAGDDIGYTIQLNNNGSDPAVHAVLSAETPVGTTFQSIVAPAGWDCATPPVGGTGSIDCSKSTMSAGDSAVFTLVVGVELCTGDGTTIYNTVAASSDGADVTPGDNSTTVETMVAGADCGDSDLCSVDGCDPGIQQCVNAPMTCTAIDSCHEAGVCDGGTGLCSNPVKPDGTDCDDSDPTTCADLCGGGSCVGTPVPEPAEINGTVGVGKNGGSATIVWDDPSGEYNVYAGTKVAGPWIFNHTCLNPSGPISAMSAEDPVVPAVLWTHYYVVTRVDQCRESISGRDSFGTPRTDPWPCSDPGS